MKEWIPNFGNGQCIMFIWHGIMLIDDGIYRRFSDFLIKVIERVKTQQKQAKYKIHKSWYIQTCMTQIWDVLWIMWTFPARFRSQGIVRIHSEAFLFFYPKSTRSLTLDTHSLHFTFTVYTSAKRCDWKMNIKNFEQR